MRHRRVRPFGQSIPPARGLSMILALLVIGMIYQRSRDPAMWRWLATGNELAAAEEDQLPKPAAAVSSAAPVALVEGPNDRDAEEQASFRERAELLTDRAPLRPREMIPYWQLMQWSLTEPLAEAERRAGPEPAFSQIWEKPEDFRGQPITLRMHLRRVLQYEAPENPLGLKQVYEGWGWTDHSKSFPYVVVFPELPAGLPVGNEIEADIVFTGYFLKIMGYTAFDANRGAPLLVGRVRLGRPGGGTSAAPKGIGNRLDLMILVASLGLVGVALIYGWTLNRNPRKAIVSALPDRLGDEGTFTIPQDPVTRYDTPTFPPRNETGP